MNENFIDFVHSEIDKRARIYFPVYPLLAKYNKLFTSEEMNNFSQQPEMPVEDSTLYPYKQYIISKIQGVLKYSSDNTLFIEIQNHEGKNITVEEIANQYYTNPEDYFEQTNKINHNTAKSRSPDGHDVQTAEDITQ